MIDEVAIDEEESSTDDEEDDGLDSITEHLPMSGMNTKFHNDGNYLSIINTYYIGGHQTYRNIIIDFNFTKYF